MPLKTRAASSALAIVFLALVLSTPPSPVSVQAQTSEWLGSHVATKLQWLALVLQAGHRQAVCWKRPCQLEATFEVANDGTMHMLFVDVDGFNVTRVEVRQETMKTLERIRVTARNVFDMAPPSIYLKESQGTPGKPFYSAHFTCTLPKAPPPSEPVANPTFEQSCRPAK